MAPSKRIRSKIIKPGEKSLMKNAQICDTNIFIDKWMQMMHYRQQIDYILAPAKEAILSTMSCPTKTTQIWGEVELIENTAHEYSIIFHGEYYSHGEMGNNSYTIPLIACLNGKEGVLAFFKDEKDKAAAEIRAASERRELHERDERYRRYMNLKAEFEPNIEVLLALPVPPESLTRGR